MRLRTWLRALATAAAFTLVGVTLMTLPWLPDWNRNFFSGNSRAWYSVWINPYFRGAVSGVGVLNLWVSFLEVYYLLRGGRRREPAGGSLAGPPRSG